LITAGGSSEGNLGVITNLTLDFLLLRWLGNRLILELLIKVEVDGSGCLSRMENSLRIAC
jgi:hypothetical protein